MSWYVMALTVSHTYTINSLLKYYFEVAELRYHSLHTPVDAVGTLLHSVHSCVVLMFMITTKVYCTVCYSKQIFVQFSGTLQVKLLWRHTTWASISQVVECYIELISFYWITQRRQMSAYKFNNFKIQEANRLALYVLNPVYCGQGGNFKDCQ